MYSFTVLREYIAREIWIEHSQHVDDFEKRMRFEDMKNGSEEAEAREYADIAVVGMGGRFPGARTIDEFWHNLCNGVESVTFFTDEQFLAAGGDPDLLSDPRLVKAGALIEDADMFDASFFGFRSREAELLDPQHRVFLECAYGALEQAGYDYARFAGVVGVYAGAGSNKYLLHNVYPQVQEQGQVDVFQAVLSSSGSTLPTRVSYLLNFTGPSMFVQTACSTSLVAVHLACQDLLAYRCDLALAGGVSISPLQKQGYLYIDNGPVSPDGHCRTFDAEGRGTVGGDGVGVVVLKRLEDALTDGDTIYAVIKGSAVNNDGANKAGFMAPSVQGQTEVIVAAHTLAGVDPGTITYVETHGTATPIGDPIEVTALTRAFRISTDKNRFCALGSVKTNIGHVDAAAGVAGFIKTALALKHRHLPPSLHFSRPNPHIDFESSPFYVNTHLQEWKAKGTPLRAGVSAFGIGGTNAHVVLQEAPPVEVTPTRRSWHILPLSAKTETALQARIRQFADYFEHPSAPLADIAYTLQVGRPEFAHRALICCNESTQARTQLQEELLISTVQERQQRAVAFMFPGGGAQYVNMGRELYDVEPVFREQIDQCLVMVHTYLEYDLRAILYPDPEHQEEAARQLRKPINIMVAIFIIEYALAKLWISLGIQPHVMIGHSLGEYTAACLSKVMSLRDALRLVVLRGKIYERLARGATLTIPLSEARLRPFLHDRLSLAAINSPSHCVVSGPVEAVDELEQRLTAAGQEFHRLQGDGAAHSSLLDPFLDEFTEAVKKVELHAPTLPYISNLTGALITEAETTDPLYWTHHLRHTVRFSEGIQVLLRDPELILLEVGPGQTLRRLAAMQAKDTAERIILSSMRHPRDAQADTAVWLQTLGQLWLAGVAVNWQGLYVGERRQRVPLPTYPFERQRYWLDPPGHQRHAATRQPEEPSSASSPYWTTTWKRTPGVQKQNAAAQAKTWLLWADDALGEALVRHLEADGQRAILVTEGSTFAKRSESHYTINLQNRQEYASLLAALDQGHCWPDYLLHCCLLSGVASNDSDMATFDHMQQHGLYSVLCLAEGMSAYEEKSFPRFWICTPPLHDIVGDETVVPAAASLSGAYHYLSGLHAETVCTLIDIVRPSLEAAQIDQFARLVLAEVAHGSSEGLVAYRHSHRWTAVQQPLTSPKARGTSTLKEGGSYVIVNGTGRAGYTLAALLAQQSQLRLAILDAHEATETTTDGEPRVFPVKMAEWHDDISQLEATIDLATREDRHPEGMEADCARLGVLYLCNYFASQGVPLRAGEHYHIAEIRQKLRLLPKFEKFFANILLLLQEQGFVAVHEDTIACLATAPAGDEAGRLKAELDKRYPQFTYYMALLEHTMSHYPQTLSGEVAVSSVLFPDGTDSLLRPVMEQEIEHSYTRVHLDVAAELIERLARVAPERTLRILEVGAGQGHFTWRVVPRLQKLGNVEYYFTDISRSFVLNARKRAARDGLDCMRFDVLDIAQDPEKQGYEHYSFDVVIEFGVIHATPHITETVQHIQKLLVPGGVFFAIQTPRERQADLLITALAEGWWNFEADDLRKNNLNALLDHAQWETLLLSQGFHSVDIYPSHAQQRTAISCMLIVAQQPASLKDDAYVRSREECQRQQEQVQQERVRRVEALRALGSSCISLPIHMAEETQVQNTFRTVREQLGPIHGVVYLAPPFEKSKQDGSEVAQCERFFQKWMPGMLAIEAELAAEQSLEFWLAVGGQVAGTVDGQATQALLDTLSVNAVRRAKEATFQMSVRGSVDTIDQEIFQTLMAFDDVHTVTVMSSQAVSISPREVGDAQINASEQGQRSLASKKGRKHSRPHLKDEYLAPRTEQEQRVADLWEEILAIAPVGIHDNFFELGGESLLATQFLSRLRDLFEVSLPVRAFFERATVAGVVAQLEEAKSVAEAEAEIAPVPRVARRVSAHK